MTDQENLNKPEENIDSQQKNSPTQTQTPDQSSSEIKYEDVKSGAVTVTDSTPEKAAELKKAVEIYLKNKFMKGELLPLKGVNFQVASITGDGIIIIPHSYTKGELKKRGK